MLDQFEIPGIKVQMFMAAEAEVRSLHPEQTDTAETGVTNRASVWDHLADALASLNAYVSKRRSSTYQTPKSASEC